MQEQQVNGGEDRMKQNIIPLLKEKGRKFAWMLWKRERRRARLMKQRPGFVLRHYFALLVIRVICIVVTLALMSLIIVFVPSLAAGKERIKLRKMRLPQSVTRRAMVQVSRLTDPAEVLDILLNAPQEAPQALSRMMEFVRLHLTAWAMLWKTSPTFRAGLVAMFVHPLGKHPRILQEVFGFLFAFFLVQLADPFLTPLVDFGMTEEESMAQSLGYASLLRLNTAILLRIVMRSAVRMVIHSAISSFGQKLGHWAGPRVSRQIERVGQNLF